MSRWLQRLGMRETPRGIATDATRRWKRLTVGSMIALALVGAAVPARGASDNTNLIQQVLTIVQSIQSVIVGTDVSVASLQSQIAAIRTKTDKLPADTAATLIEIKNGTLNRIVVKSMRVHLGEEKHVECASSAPFLMTLHGKSRDGELAVVNNDGIGYGESIDSSKSAHIVSGGNALTMSFISVHARLKSSIPTTSWMCSSPFRPRTMHSSSATCDCRGPSPVLRSLRRPRRVTGCSRRGVMRAPFVAGLSPDIHRVVFVGRR